VLLIYDILRFESTVVTNVLIYHHIMPKVKQPDSSKVWNSYTAWICFWVYLTT